ncbi:MAG: radical SAM protein [Promethearchaeota archaeon]
MGFPAIASYCKKEGGFDVRMINVPLELHLNKKFSLLRKLKSLEFKYCAIDLHWLLHSYGAIKITEMVKEINSDIPVILGGYTATYYATEILENFPTIDAIIQGEGEVPLLKYLETNEHDKTLENVPNLVYRDGERIKKNGISYVAEDLDQFDFVDLSFMDHSREYFKLCEDSLIPFSLMIARGCPFNCPFCGGGQRAQYILNKRRQVIFRSPEKVVQDIKEIDNTYKVSTVFFGHGYYPANEKYFLEIFRKIRQERIDIGGALEIWRLPFNRLLHKFSKTFDKGVSLLEYNIQAFSDKTIQKYRKVLDPTIKNDPEQIERLIRLAKYFKIPLRLWVNVGNPHETPLDLFKGLKFVMKLNAENLFTKNSVCIYSSPITASPASPTFENPEAFNIKIIQKSFQDFYNIYSTQSNKFGELDLIINYENKALSRKMKYFFNLLFFILDYPLFMKNISRFAFNAIKRKKRKQVST